MHMQVITYKSDFEDERRDRASAHGKVADLEKEIDRLTGRSGHEKVTFKHEIDELKRDKLAIRDELQRNQQELETAKEDLETVKAELKKHQTVLVDLETVHQKRVQEVADLNVKAETAMSELQAKASQVKQYAKENDTLKQEIQKLKQQVIVLYVFTFCMYSKDIQCMWHRACTCTCVCVHSELKLMYNGTSDNGPPYYRNLHNVDKRQ